MPETTLTWLGHATFRFDTPGGKRIYIDPFLNGNPKCPESELEPERIDVIALTHGHGDHLGDTVELAKKHGCTVIAPVEMADWLQGKQGVENVLDPNKGGTVEAAGVKFTLTNAHHSSSNNDLEYMGEPVGIVAAIENGPKLYFAGDTCVFGDMQIIRRLYEPDVAILPIGGHYTMDPREAALALEFLGTKRCVPCHYGTFPPLKGTPAAAARARAGRAGGRAGARRVADAMRQRWWGGSGRRVPELAVEGDPAVPVAEALVLDGVDDLEPLAEAFLAGRPVVVRASSPEEVRAALARPEVAAVLVPEERRDLLELDLTKLTYG